MAGMLAGTAGLPRNGGEAGLPYVQWDGPEFAHKAGFAVIQDEAVWRAIEEGTAALKDEPIKWREGQRFGGE
jgi:hypothetical protein